MHKPGWNQKKNISRPDLFAYYDILHQKHFSNGDSNMLKIAVIGKGGVGKTMIASCLAYLFAAQGNQVYAIDADPNPTLSQALGFPKSIVDQIQPIRAIKELIHERVGSDYDSYSTYFRLNPFVEDIPERFSSVYRSIRLLIMGATRGMNTGCACAENTLLKALVSHLIVRSKETVIMDMVAGTEHLGRGTAEKVDAMIIVTEPTTRSIEAAKNIMELLGQIKNTKRYIIVNKIRDEDNLRLVEKNFPEEVIAGHIRWNNKVLDAENRGVPVYDTVPEIIEQINFAVTKITCKQNVAYA